MYGPVRFIITTIIMNIVIIIMKSTMTTSCAALFLLRQLENLSFLCSSDKT